MLPQGLAEGVVKARTATLITKPARKGNPRNPPLEGRTHSRAKTSFAPIRCPGQCPSAVSLIYMSD
jgi:hypothetical protein